MKEKYRIFLMSNQPSGYGGLSVLSRANNTLYKSEYHAGDYLKNVSNITPNPNNRFYGSDYTILPIYFNQTLPTYPPETNGQWFSNVSYGVYKVAQEGSGSDVSFSEVQRFSKMSQATDYAKNIPIGTLQVGVNEFAVIPIYKHTKLY